MFIELKFIQKYGIHKLKKLFRFWILYMNAKY